MTNQELILRFRKKLNSGACLYGPFMKTEDPMFVEIAGLAGFDFVILDMEHGPVTLQAQQNNVRAAIARDILPIVRVKDISENTIGSVFDIGACGIQVPQVKRAEQARKVVEFSKFYPYGMRGVCRFVRAADYSAMERSLYFEHSKELILIVQLEGQEAIENLDEILLIEGIDILFIGPYDLSQSLGVPGQINNPIVVKKMINISEKARKLGKNVGTFVDTLDNLRMWKDFGIQYLSYNTDAGLFLEACRSVLNHI